ncbi:hypothetical protein [Streptomyces peucetius]|uniref:Uncharacterized protein n=1 Tax=Streptomyces peucetius TaxID=1950 RepID=A0ABY6IFE0_STRPE|nr:hypothetical protein [Streptomyces peucetius]UYQ65738.1 hypothetical protein OGH68_32655 [Streptomyces peucetius]
MDNPDEGFEVGLEACDLGFVAFPELFELDDLLPQALREAIGYLTSRCRRPTAGRCPCGWCCQDEWAAFVSLAAG